MFARSPIFLIFFLLLTVGNAAGPSVGRWANGQTIKTFGACGMLMLAACQQLQPPPTPPGLETDLMECWKNPNRHSEQFCDQVERAYRIYLGMEDSDSDQNPLEQTEKDNFNAVKPVPSGRQVSRPGLDDQPLNRPQLGANPFQARVASVLIAESFINEQLRRLNTELVQDLHLQLGSDGKRIFLLGLLQLPVDEMRAINLDPKLGAFRFHLSMRMQATPEGYLILELPLNETYIYPALSQNLESDRVIVPVQLLSLAVASIRSYLAALSGDFSGFDQQTARIKADIKSLEKARAAEKNSDAREVLSNEIAAQRLQLEAVPIERKQLELMSKEVGPLVGFLSERELDINQALSVNKNALVLNLRLSDLLPYLRDVDVGGVRLVREKRNGQGENFLVVDANAELGQVAPATDPFLRRSQEQLPVPPSLILRLNQALFVSTAVLEAQKEAMGDKISDLDIQLRDDGVHVSGRYLGFAIPVPFDAIVEFVTVEPDVLETRVRGLEVAGLDVPFLTGFVLNLLRDRLEQVFEERCTFEDVPQTANQEQALRVRVGINKAGEAAPLVPAFPDLHLLRLDVQDRGLLLDLGRL